MLTVYTLEKNEQWDAIVRSFSQYDVYWLSGYVKAFFLHGDGEPLLFFYSKDGTRGINVVMKRDIAKDKYLAGKIVEGQYFDFATPYGYGGWLIEGEHKTALFNAYKEWCESNAIISEFVRFHPMIKNHESCEGLYNVIRLGEVVHMDITSPDLIWENIISKNRNVIRKAIKNGVKIYNGRYPKIYEKFRAIYNETMNRDAAEDYYYFGEAFYDSVLNDFSQNAQVFYAEKDGVVIAASIMLAANGRMNYHLSGSLREYSNLAPTNLLIYKAAKWGSQNGCKTLYLGGGVGSGEDNLFKFKRAFYKGALNHFYIGKKIWNPKKYEQLCSLKAPLQDDSFFPAYRKR